MNQNVFTEYLPYLFLLIGFVFIAISIFYKSDKSKLKQTGMMADGIVYEQEREININALPDNSYQSTNKKTTIRFVTEKEDWITGIIQQDFQIFYTGQYKNGDVVKVYYDPNNPSNFYVDTKQSESTARVVMAIIGLVFIIIGLYKLFL